MRSRYLIVCLGALALATATCQAQPPRGGNRGPAGSMRETLFRLLDMRQVRKELRLRPSQIEMLSDLQADLGEQLQAAFPRGAGSGDGGGAGGLRDPAAGDRARRDRSEAIRDAFRKIRSQRETLVAVILDPEQSQRLAEIRLQDEGPRALDRQEVREQLDVTEDQLSKLQALRRANGDRSLSRNRQRQKLDQDLLAVLSEEQRQKFKALQGEAFEFPFLRSGDLQGLKDPRGDDRPRRP